MLIKSQVKRMHVLNNCVSNGFIYLLYMTRFVCTIWSQGLFTIYPKNPEISDGMQMVRLFFSSRTEISTGKWKFLKGSPKFPNGISE